MRSLPILLTLAIVAACYPSFAHAAFIFRLPHQLQPTDLLDPINGTAPAVNLTTVQANCTSTITHASLHASESEIFLQGIANNTNDDCFAANVTFRPASFFTVYTKSVASIRDANHKLHRGKVCDIMLPDWSSPINETGKINMTLPLTNLTLVNCSFPSTTPLDPHPTSTHETATYEPTTTTVSRDHETTTTQAPTKTTTSHKPSPTDEDGGGSWVSGKATYYNPDVGACGENNDDGDMVVALGPAWYGNMNAVSKYCGRKVRITGPRGNSITATVKDACPPCDKGHLDLSPAAFGKLGAYETGILKIKWQFL